MVVQDAASYQATLDALERAEANAGIRRGLQAVAEGKTVPLEDVIASIKKKQRARAMKGKRGQVSH
jgi:predicted transcriptional regulator